MPESNFYCQEHFHSVQLKRIVPRSSSQCQQETHSAKSKLIPKSSSYCQNYIHSDKLKFSTSLNHLHLFSFFFFSFLIFGQTSYFPYSIFLFFLSYPPSLVHILLSSLVPSLSSSSPPNLEPDRPLLTLLPHLGGGLPDSPIIINFSSLTSAG